MPPLTDSQLDWFSKKLKGNFAETICETHFNSLDYNVEKVGIESIAPTYVKRSNLYNTNFVQEQLNKTPDFLVSNANEAFFVEVKFRSTINNEDTDFYNESANLIKIYKSIILKPEYVNDITNEMSYDEIYGYIRSGNKLKENTKVIFYVLLPQKMRNCYVHLFLPQLITQHQYGWRNCKVNNIDTLFGIEGLKDRYENLIEPFLETIFENNK